MSAFPLRYTVGVHTRTESGMDAHRNPVPTYKPPLDRPGTPVKVYGWYTPSATEPQIPGHERTIADVALMVPPGFPATSTSVIDLPGGPKGQFEVIGDPEDYSYGPFGWKPGSVLNLRRITG